MPTVLDILQSMADSPQSPFPVYFDFDGIKSSLVLPTLPRWPFNKTNPSFTAVSWVCVESFSDPQGAPNYQPRLFSFLDDEGAGMEVFFQNGHLVFQNIAPPSGASADGAVAPSPVPIPLAQRTERKVFSSFIFKPKVWYCIAVSFNIQSRLIGRIGEVKLYVDGKLISKDILKQPIVFANLTHCRIGSNALVHTPEVSSMLRVNSLFGQMAEMVFFDSDLDAKFIEQMQTGSRTAAPPQEDYDNSSRGEWATMFDGPSQPSARPTMYFSPRASSSLKQAVAAGIISTMDCPDGTTALCFDASPHARDAFLTYGLTTVQRRHLKEIMGCISGGIKAVFPVLLMLDKQEGIPDAANTQSDSLATLPSRYATLGRSEAPLAAPANSGGPVDDPRGPQDPHSGASIAVQTFKFVCRMLIGARDLQQDMQASNGFMQMAFLLLKVSPFNLTTHLIDCLLEALEHSAPSNEVFGANASAKSNSSLPEHLQDAIIRYLLLDLNIWIYTPSWVQKHLLQEALPRVYQRRSYLRYRYGSFVARLLEAMRTFYWSIANPDSMAVDPIVSSATKKVLSQRPDPSVLRLLRQDMLSLLDQVLVHDITIDEAKEIIGFLVDSKDPELSVDVLRFVHKMIQLDSSFLQQLRSIGLEVFLVILDNKSARVRAQTLLVIQAILLAHQSAPAAAGRPRSSSSSSPSDLLDQLFPVASMQEFLRPHRLEPATYNAMFGILVGLRRPTVSFGSQLLKKSSDKGLQSDATIPKLDVDDTTLLRVSSILPALLRLAHASLSSTPTESPASTSSSQVVYSSSSSLAEQALQDLYLLLTVRPENRDALLSCFGWQLWLLEGLSANEGEARRVVFDITVNIFKVLMAHQMSIKGTGAQFLYELECFVRIASENGLQGQVEFFKHFVHLTAILLRKDLHVLNSSEAATQRLILLKDIDNKNKIVLNNFVGALFFLLEYLYYMDLGGLNTPSRQEASTIAAAVTDPVLADDVYTVLHMVELSPFSALQSIAGSAPSATFSVKKGTLRSAGAVAVIYKVLATKLYHSDDLKSIGECLNDVLPRLTKQGHKIIEVQFTFFHALNALAVSRISDPTWTLHLKQSLFPFLGELFQNFKAHFYTLKQFTEHQLAYLEQICAGSETDLGSPLLASILSVLRGKLGDVEKEDLSSCDSVVKQQQRLHKATLARYRRSSEQEAEVVQRTGNAVLQLQQQFSARSANPKLVSHSVLTERYRRAAVRRLALVSYQTLSYLLSCLNCSAYGERF
jgi:hypothetical protein